MSSYILGEEQAETRRLISQAARDPVDDLLKWAGLKPGMRIIDAGCGPGVYSRTLARLTGPAGRVDGFDISPSRIEAASSLPIEPGSAPLTFRTGDVYAPPFTEGEADFVLCQFVFEYLQEPERAVRSLSKLLKPGGILLLRDGDGNGQTVWPMPEVLERSLPTMFAAMAKTGFDAYSGRKLFLHMRRAGLSDIQGQVGAWVTSGCAPDEERSNWTQRLEALSPLGQVAFGSQEAYREVADAYLRMLENEDTFRFTNIVSVRGTKL
jgi:ubiquinone/menaquinone biosynthesis C-methylase UbiE